MTTVMLDVDVGVQVQLDLMLADEAQRAVRQAESRCARRSMPRLPISSAMSTVPTEPNSLPSAPACISILSTSPSSFLARACAAASSAAALASSSARRDSNLAMLAARGQRGLALRDQVIPRVAGLHAHAVTDAADVIDFLEQNDFHVSTLVPGRVAAPRSSTVAQC